MFDTARLKAELGHIQFHLAAVAAGPRRRDIIAPLLALGDTPINPSKLLWQALHNDCLRIVYVALAADERIVDDEIEATYEYLFSVARHYADVRPGTYGAHAALEPEAVRDFLARYADDDGPFGFRCSRTQWAGLDACRRAAVAGDGEPLDAYTRLAGWLCDEAFRIAAVDVADDRQQKRLAEIDGLRRALAERSNVPQPGTDLRLDAFLRGPRVFGAVTHADSVFIDDPFDVEEVHAEVRETFERLVAQAETPVRHGPRGRMLLVLGDSGAGKTHLMRAFRGYVHRGGHGFAAYAQLQSRSPDYGRYLLHNVVESLERRYRVDGDEASGLVELARGLPRLLGDGMRGAFAMLADEDWAGSDALAAHVDRLVDELLRHEELAPFDPDVLRALLYLMCQDPRITPRVLKYLRCEPMSAHDRRWIGDLQPRRGDDEPIWMMQQLARLAFVTQEAAFVLMVDQAELAGFDERTIESFKRAVDALYAVVSAVPSTVAVIACLKDMYQVARPQLSASLIDRLTADPPQATLAMERTAPELAAIVGRRLEWLHGEAGAVFRREDPTYPVPAALLEKLTSMRTRSALEACHHFQEACSAAGRILEDWTPAGAGTSTPAAAPPGVDESELDRIAAEWNDRLHGASGTVPSEDERILDLIAEALTAATAELDAPIRVRSRDGYLDVDLGEGAATRALTIGVTNATFRGGRFGTELRALVTASQARTAVSLRTAPYPQGPASSAALAELLKAGGRRVECTAGDLHAMRKMQGFAAERQGAAFDAWRRRERPLLGRDCFASMLDLPRVEVPPGDAPSAPETPETPDAAAPSARAAAPRPTNGTSTHGPTPAATVNPPRPVRRGSSPRPPTGELQLGVRTGLDARPFELPIGDFVRHAGVLGSPGSGKTTLALNLVEQMLERDVAVVLVDRKGDLAGYARDRWHEGTADTPRAKALAARIDVRVFTPGSSAGRPLGFGVVPRGEDLDGHDRARLVTHAASALGAMLRFGSGARDQTRRAILTQAIGVLSRRGIDADIETLIDLLGSRDDALVALVPKFDERLFESLVTDLETLRINDSELFARHAEPLSADLLLARGAGGRTPLTIISTKFLGDTARVQAWASHLFVELARWCTRTPRPHLQALLMLDEADQYMPAGMSRPPSKEPLLDLLKRARAGGLGVMLATQTPGDLDYKSRDLITSWFIGKIGDHRSIDKVRPLLERKPSVAGRLGQLPSGQFVVVNDAGVAEIQRRPSLLRTDQLPEHEILALARSHRPAAAS